MTLLLVISFTIFVALIALIVFGLGSFINNRRSPTAVIARSASKALKAAEKASEDGKPSLAAAQYELYERLMQKL